MAKQTQQAQQTGITAEQQMLLDQLAALQAENAALKAQTAARGTGAITFKVSEKGAVSVYGMGRWPVTLYAGQWRKLMSDESRQALEAFMQANADKLSEKPQAGQAPAAPATAPAVDTMAPRLVK
jgi:hypothetical protein